MCRVATPRQMSYPHTNISHQPPSRNTQRAGSFTDKKNSLTHFLFITYVRPPGSSKPKNRAPPDKIRTQTRNNGQDKTRRQDPKTKRMTASIENSRASLAWRTSPDMPCRHSWTRVLPQTAKPRLKPPDQPIRRCREIHEITRKTTVSRATLAFSRSAGSTQVIENKITKQMRR